MISSATDSIHVGQQGSRQELSTSKKEKVLEILSNYDASNLTKEDAQSISNQFKENRIAPSASLKEVITGAGFNADDLKTLSMDSSTQGTKGAKAPPPPPPPPPPAGEKKSENDTQSNTEEKTILEEILAEILDPDTSDEADQTTQVVDYTNRILHLNDDAKQSVLETFSKYSPQNSTYSKDESRTLITSTLNEILKNDNNYTSLSFYA